MNRKLGAIVAACICVATIAPVPESQAASTWPFNPPYRHKIRSFATPANNWYAITFELPTDASISTQIGCRARPGITSVAAWKMATIEDLDGNNLDEFFSGSFGRSWNESRVYVGARGEEVGSQGTWREETRGEGTPAGQWGGLADGVNGAAYSETLRHTWLLFCTSDGGGMYNTRINISATKPIKVVAESWGRGVRKIIFNQDFEGGRSVGAGATTRDVEPGLIVAADAAAAADLTRTVKFNRAATAIFLPGDAYPAANVLVVPPLSTLVSIKTKDKPWWTTMRGGTVLGDSDTYYTLGRNAIAGLDPGTYQFKIDAFVAAQVIQGNGGVVPLLTGSDPMVALMTVDADFPPCSRSKVQWREKDGHRVCGPGPWRMKRGLQP